MTEARSGSHFVVGDSRESVGRTVSEADLTTWGGLVHDFTQLHFDQAHMANTPFGRPIAHGYIALNWAVGLMFPEHAAWYAPDGSDAVRRWSDVRFLAPVFVGDTLNCRRTVKELKNDEVHFRVEMLKEGTPVVAGTEIVSLTSKENGK